MHRINALAISIGVLAVVATWLGLGTPLGPQVWALFIVRGSFYHNGAMAKPAQARGRGRIRTPRGMRLCLRIPLRFAGWWLWSCCQSIDSAGQVSVVNSIFGIFTRENISAETAPAGNHPKGAR